MTSAECDDVTMTSLKDVHLQTLPCNHLPLDLPNRGAFTRSPLLDRNPHYESCSSVDLSSVCLVWSPNSKIDKTKLVRTFSGAEVKVED